MLSDLLFAALGLVMLLLAGDALVKGAVNLSLRLGIPAMIVSLTIVAFGTSAPELLIAIKSVLDDAPGIALGNVVGSNTANVLLVLGIPALIAGMETSKCNTGRSYITMVLATFLFIAVCFVGPITWIHGLVLLAVLAFMLFDAARIARAHKVGDGPACDSEDDLEDPEGADPDLESWKIGLFLILGLIGLPMGASFLVDSSINIARTMGVSETVIGLTLVAVGTSLPELATTVMAALRKQADVALGNVIGSNMFNLLAIIGVAALVGPMEVPQELMRFDIWVMLASTLLLAPFVFLRWNMRWGWGIVFSALYAIYIFIVLANG